MWKHGSRLTSQAAGKVELSWSLTWEAEIQGFWVCESGRFNMDSEFVAGEVQFGSLCRPWF